MSDKSFDFLLFSPPASQGNRMRDGQIRLKKETNVCTWITDSTRARSLNEGFGVVTPFINLIMSKCELGSANIFRGPIEILACSPTMARQPSATMI